MSPAHKRYTIHTKLLQSLTIFFFLNSLGRETSSAKINVNNGLGKEIEVNKELHNLYSSPYIIRFIKSKRIRWAKHVARIVGGRGECMYDIGGKARRKEITRKTNA
jgi:hypothetical protein